MSYLQSLIKSIGNSTASEITKSDFCTVKNFYDSGNYIINGLMGGSFFKGIPSGVVSGWAGRQGSGKTFVLLKSASEFLRQTIKDGGLVFVFESEGAYDKDRVIKLIGEDVADRFVVAQVRTIEQFKTQIFNLLNSIEKQGNNQPIFLGLDSLGMLASEVDLEYAERGENKRNMQKQQIIKTLFTIISEPLKKLDIPLMMTNHVYTAIGSYVGGDEISGGMGFKFACRNIIEMKKRKEKDGTEHIGTGVNAIVKKGLYVAEDLTHAKFSINFKGGISRYSGLFDFVVDNEIARKVNKGSLGTTLIFDDYNNYEITKKDRTEKSMIEIFNNDFLHYLDSKFQEKFSTTGKEEHKQEEKNELGESVVINEENDSEIVKIIQNNVNLTKEEVENEIKKQNTILADDTLPKYRHYKAKKELKQLNELLNANNNNHGE